MQALQQFVNQSPWDPLPVRQRIAERLSEVVRPEVWVIDDVSFPKCGKASVGRAASTAERSANGRTARSRSVSMSFPAARGSTAATTRRWTSPVRPVERKCLGVSRLVGRCSSMALGPSAKLTAVFWWSRT
ncbi:transposase [Streptomyces collinus]|uniref:transposase n=1 Tax=Streptomyces collinus TaxID=42684 RepID=UPI00332B0E6C